MDRIRYRWERNLPIGVLNSRTVKLVDNAVLILEEGVGLEDRDYQGKAITLFYSVFGFGRVKHWSDRDDFLLLLSSPDLTLAQFDALYFHKLLQKSLQRAVWIPSTVDRLKLQSVRYRGRTERWEDAYDDWERSKYAETINIRKVAEKDEWALQVYEHGYYDDTPSDRLKFIRNMWLHINDYRKREGLRPYTILQRGLLIQELFPSSTNRLFRFFWELGFIDLDYYRFRSYFELEYDSDSD